MATTKTKFHAPKVVNCAGAWSGQIAPYAFPTRPVKGQMLCLISPSRGLLKHVIRAPEVYLIPRSDGRIIVGTTVEEAGFDKRTDVATIQRLHRAAIALVPELRNAKIHRRLGGASTGNSGWTCRFSAQPRLPGYYVATGHFRDGILLAPITARVMAQVIAGRQPAHHDVLASRFCNLQSKRVLLSELAEFLSAFAVEALNCHHNREETVAPHSFRYTEASFCIH